jgi:DNA-binding response OmpR family regulator
MSTLLVYSDKPDVRERVKTAIGRRPDPGLGAVDFLEAAHGPEVIDIVDHGEADVCILDGEAAPSGGMGLSRQLKNEIPNCPPILLLVARVDDRWLATWSLADAIVTHPVDPGELTAAVVGLLRARAAALPAAGS